MRPVLIAGNWKMNFTRAEAAALAAELLAALRDPPRAQVAVFPPFTALAAVAEVLRGRTEIGLGAQDLHWEASGAYTGEVSAGMLVDAGCRYVLVGHSERRQHFSETDLTVNRKLRAALSAGLFPVVCVGETLSERDAGQVESVLARQVRGAFAGVDAEAVSRSALAYEPVWAIGTGRNATPSQAAQAHAYVRGVLSELYGAAAAQAARILYGGSVTAENAAALLSEPELDGALVGGAGLRADSFLRIIHSREAVRT